MRALASEERELRTGVTLALPLALILLIWLPGCEFTVSERDGDLPGLACEKPTGIERALPPDFSGYQSPENAAQAWRETVDLPEGTWQESERDFMILVDEDGQAVARASISIFTESTGTTFDETRFVSPSIDFCD